MCEKLYRSENFAYSNFIMHSDPTVDLVKSTSTKSHKKRIRNCYFKNYQINFKDYFQKRVR